MSKAKISSMQVRLNTPVEQRLPLGKKQKPNRVWDELNDVYSHIYGGSVTYSKTVIDLISPVTEDPDKKKYIKDVINFSNLVNLVTKDISNLQEKIKQINAQHVHLSGGSVESDEHMQSLKLHGMYVEAWEQFTSNIDETVKEISEIITNAQEQYSLNKKQLADIIDPNVITDIDFKEVK